MRRAHDAVLAAFTRVMPVLDWAFLAVGLAGAAGTAAGQLPPISGSLWARVTTSVLWLVLAVQGYQDLADEGGERERDHWEGLAHHFSDELIERWHASDSDMSLHSYMGLTWDQYRAWVECRYDEIFPEE